MSHHRSDALSLIAGLAIILAVVILPTPRGAPEPAGQPTAIPGATEPVVERATGATKDAATGTSAQGLRGAPENVEASGRLGSAAMTPGGVPKANASSSPDRTSPRPAQRSFGRPQAVQRAVRSTWYCGAGSRCTRGYPAGGYTVNGQWIGYAAISPDLRTWTGRLVRVSYRGRSVLVRIIDCNCQAEHAIDLYSSAFRRLAPLGSGVITVTLEVLG